MNRVAEGVVIVETTLGPMGVVESKLGVARILVGYGDVPSLRDALRNEYPNGEWRSTSELAGLLARYSRGERVSFDAFLLDDRDLPAFSGRVVRECRQVEHGETITYVELAKRAGRPRAARAVGSVMARNRWPIVVPCHRILRSSGGLGGYSAPLGLDFKRRLLDLESRTCRGLRSNLA